MLEIRPSTETDLADVLKVERQAFGSDEGSEIVDLVKGLLSDPSAMPLLSLLAFNDDQAVGHILFTQAQVDGIDGSVSAAILAPLAVIPEAQHQGVGGELINEGLQDGEKLLRLVIFRYKASQNAHVLFVRSAFSTIYASSHLRSKRF